MIQFIIVIMLQYRMRELWQQIITCTVFQVYTGGTQIIRFKNKMNILVGIFKYTARNGMLRMSVIMRHKRSLMTDVPDYVNQMMGL